MNYDRAQLRDEIIAIIAPALKAVDDRVEVFSARSKDLGNHDDIGAIVYTPHESISRPPGGGEARPSRAVSRIIDIEINIFVTIRGDGVDAANLADKLTRAAEIAIAKSGTTLELNALAQGFSQSNETTCVNSLSYQLQLIDEQES